MMTVTGAFITLSPLTELRCGFSRALASSLTIHRNRAGEQLAEVAPSLVSS